MKTDQMTCGDRYQLCLEKLDIKEYEMRRFVHGAVIGQAEKVFNGTCSAAMFRVNIAWHGFMREVAEVATEVYGLALHSFGDEFWLVSPTVPGAVMSTLPNLAMGSVEYHMLRSQLCGIPVSKIDLLYHERKNFNERCDVAAGNKPCPGPPGSTPRFNPAANGYYIDFRAQAEDGIPSFAGAAAALEIAAEQGHALTTEVCGVVDVLFYTRDGWLYAGVEVDKGYNLMPVLAAAKLYLSENVFDVLDYAVKQIPKDKS